jgi:hypothetical protein
MTSKPIAYTSQEQLDRMAKAPGNNFVMWGEPLPYHNDIPLYTTVDQLGGSPEDLRNVLCGVIEIFGIEGAQKITEYALKYRGTNAFDGRKIEALPPMPATVDRRPYIDDEPDGYLESDKDWAANNSGAVTWLADNHAAIREALR